MIHPFERTVCSCADCIECCKRKPGPLVLSDIHALRDAGISVEHTLVRSPGGIYLGPHGPFRVETITPRRVNGRCVFLSADRCVIHDIAPFGCAYFDTHMGRDEANARSIYMAGLQMAPEYHREREALGEE